MAFLMLVQLFVNRWLISCVRRFFTLQNSTLILLIFFCLFNSGLYRLHANDSREYQIKAAFLFNFVQFVKWPPASFPDPSSPFRIGILGDDPFGSALDETIRGETIGRHRLVILRAQKIEDLKECQIIFVSRSEENRITEILSQINSKPILTVSEVQSFTRSGGNINFYLSSGKIHFEINPQSAERSGLKMSSQLLTLGKIVKQ